jgi:ubiquinone/menaquinone biosynthesis C-methylase UbiE
LILASKFISQVEESGPMQNKAEEIVSKFYNTVGWETENNITEDARRWEDLREYAREYVSKCRIRVLRHIPDSGENILDMASGPIQYKEYLEYSKNYKKRYCIDLSSKALEEAKRKIGDHGMFLHGSFLDIQLDEDFFDCTISLHTIYHVDKDKQEEAVRKLIRVTKPEKPVIIVYSNPNTLIHYLAFPFRLLRILRNLLNREVDKKDKLGLYVYMYPIEWWNRFGDVADIRILPWRSFLSNHQKILIPNNKIGRKMFHILY